MDAPPQLCDCLKLPLSLRWAIMHTCQDLCEDTIYKANLHFLFPVFIYILFGSKEDWRSFQLQMAWCLQGLEACSLGIWLPWLRKPAPMVVEWWALLTHHLLGFPSWLCSTICKALSTGPGIQYMLNKCQALLPSSGLITQKAINVAWHLCLFCTWGNWSSKRLCNLPKVTKLVSGETRAQDEFVWFLSLCY